MISNFYYMYITYDSLSPCICTNTVYNIQWRHQDLKSGGARRGQRLIMGGQTCARSAHSEREARADFFFWANMCAERT